MATAVRVHWTLVNVLLLLVQQLVWAEEPADHQRLQSQVLQLLQQVRTEEAYDIAVIANLATDRTQSCIFTDLIGRMDVAVVLIDQPLSHALNSEFSRALVVLICARHVDNAFAQKHLQMLQSRHKARHIFYAPHQHHNNNTLVRSFCQTLQGLEIHNALIVQRDFATTHNYHTCRTFPSAPIQPYVARTLHSGARIFANQFRNMHGAPIYTQPDQLVPRTMLYYDREGRLHMGGYVGKLVTAYAAHHNATLVLRYPIRLGKTANYLRLQEAAANGSLDMSTCLTSPLGARNFSAISYPYEIISYCFMVPLPQTVPINRLFTGIVQPPILVLIFLLIVVYALLLGRSMHRPLSFVDVLLSDKALRGMLGQSFALPRQPSLRTKFVCFLLCYTSLMTNTAYQSYLQSFLMHPPLLPIAKTYRDMEAAGIKVLFYEYDFRHITDHMPNTPLLQYLHIVEIADKISYFQRYREAFDTRYAYPVSSGRWVVFDEQQSFYKRKLFYYTEEQCMSKFAILGLPVRPNLPYRELFEHFILRIQEAGIMQMWLTFNLYDMVRLNLTVLEDLSGDVSYGKPLTLKDFSWIWGMYALCVVVCLLGFVWETIKWRRHGKGQTSVKQRRRKELKKSRT